MYQSRLLPPSQHQLHPLGTLYDPPPQYDSPTFLPQTPATPPFDHGGGGWDTPFYHQPPLDQDDKAMLRHHPPPLAVPPVSPGLCVICQDRATGRHYGANSCDGCKGFFRRTIRKQQHYTCRFERHCLIDKDKRNSCRFCRFQKCMEAGMKSDAVQSERDRIQTRRLKGPTSAPISPARTQAFTYVDVDVKSAPVSPLPSPVGPRASFQETIKTLMKAEEYYTASQLRATVITRTDNQKPSFTDPPVIANMTDISESMRQQLLFMVEWAKTLSPFYSLSMSDQVVLLRNYAAQHLLICVAYRSRAVEDRLLLTNSTCLPRTIDSSDISDAKYQNPSRDIQYGYGHVTIRVLDELVRPMRLLDVDEVEFVCLRAIVFFNPMAKGLEDAVSTVGETRQTILGALQHHITTKTGAMDPYRFANLLLLLPPLQGMGRVVGLKAISQNLREDLQLASMFGMARIDTLLQELLIPESSNDDDGQALALGDKDSSIIFPLQNPNQVSTSLKIY